MVPRSPITTGITFTLKVGHWVARSAARLWYFAVFSLSLSCDSPECGLCYRSHAHATSSMRIFFSFLTRTYRSGLHSVTGLEVTTGLSTEIILFSSPSMPGNARPPGPLYSAGSGSSSASRVDCTSRYSTRSCLSLYAPQDSTWHADRTWPTDSTPAPHSLHNSDPLTFPNFPYSGGPYLLLFQFVGWGPTWYSLVLVTPSCAAMTMASDSAERTPDLSQHVVAFMSTPGFLSSLF